MGPDSPLTPSSHLQVLTKGLLKAWGVPLSNASLCRMERAGTFPRRFYLSAKTPVWSASAVREWLVLRQAAAEPNHATEKATMEKRRRRAVAMST
jgi:prophage regulatory protein